MPSNISPILPIVSLLSAFIGAAAALFGHRWRYRADYRNHLVTQLITTITNVADLSTDYWLMEIHSPSSANALEQAKIEAKIEGLVEKLDGSIEIVRPHLSKIDMLGIDIPASRFVDALTGGQFSVPARAQDAERAKEAQAAAAFLILEISKAANRRVLGIM
ncbi:hypothetical protein Q5698_15545 [Brucella intermedia]|uniref:hypothetical protein n=1 Tax=Brucella intermedia TaxID=94625 RepID=UPI00163D3467|nr:MULTISPECIES: hypothetical protein [Brucella/Ochrobactrum group]MBC2887295.1 hypothetical protein [Ochrobactrum sp. CM-21-5]WLF99125.1 hypothetical protein Q5698_15545 [Brucella intermedia]